MKFQHNPVHFTYTWIGLRIYVSLYHLRDWCAGKTIVKALYDYTGAPANGDEIPDLSFKKDDLMEVTQE